MKALELKKALKEMGMTEEKTYNMVLRHMLTEFKADRMTKDQFICGLAEAGYLKNEGAIKMSKASGSILETHTVIL